MSNQDYLRGQAENDAKQNKGPANNPGWTDPQKKAYDATYNQTRKDNSGKK